MENVTFSSYQGHFPVNLIYSKNKIKVRAISIIIITGIVTLTLNY